MKEKVIKERKALPPVTMTICTFIIAGVALNVYQFNSNNNLKNELYTLEAEIENLKNESDTLNSKLEVKKEEMTALYSQLEELKATISSLESDNKSLSENFEELKATKENLEESSADIGLTDSNPVSNDVLPGENTNWSGGDGDAASIIKSLPSVGSAPGSGDYSGGAGIHAE